MHLSRSTNLGLQIIAELSRQQVQAGETTRLTAAGISEALGASPTHVAKLTSRLVEIGIIKSSRGRAGGIHIIKGGLRFRLGELIRKLEGPVEQVDRYIQPLVAESSGSNSEAQRSFELVLQEAEDRFYAELDKFTVADVLDLDISGQHFLMKD